MPGFVILDDSPTVRLFLKSCLSRVDPEAPVWDTDNPNEALRRLKSEKPEAVFLDMVLGGGLFGTQVVKALLKADPATKVILTTSLSSDDKMVREAIAAGAYGYLAKPVRVDAVRDVLDEVRQGVGGG